MNENGGHQFGCKMMMLIDTDPIAWKNGGYPGLFLLLLLLLLPWSPTQAQRISPLARHHSENLLRSTSVAGDHPVPDNMNDDHEEEEAWQRLDARPLPAWYDQAKFGIFIHWGVFSVPSFGSEWFWYNWQTLQDPETRAFVQRTERPQFSYPEYAPRFSADLFRPRQWATWLADSGAQYVVLTSKHHEGFCNWNSTAIPATYNWNAVDNGPHRDLVGELGQAVKNTISPMTGRNLTWGLYHSLLEWFHPLYVRDRANQWSSQDFVLEKTLPELYDLVERYQPELIWSDGDWEANSTYWRSTEFLHWYSTQSAVAATAVWNDRWGQGTSCRHGAYWSCQDGFVPDQPLLHKKWESALTMDHSSWGWNRPSSLENYRSVKELIHTLIHVVAYNGNMLLNLGPGADGIISPIFIDRLLAMGDWLKVNGEAIYATKPWLVCQNETKSNVYYTRGDDQLYVHILEWPTKSVLYINCPQVTSATTAYMLGAEEPIRYHDREHSFDVADSSGTWLYTPPEQGTGIDIHLPILTPDRIPCQHAWVVVMTGIANLNNGTVADDPTWTSPR